MNFKSILLIIFAIQSNLFAQQFNRPVPADLFDYEYVDNGFLGDDYLLGTLLKNGTNANSFGYKSPYPVIFDSKGYVAWYAKPSLITCSDFKYHPTANVYTYAAVTTSNQSFEVLDDQFNYLTTLDVVNGAEDLHDIQRAANGNWLLATKRVDVVDLSAFTFNGTQGSATTSIIGFGVQELDAANNIIFEWNSNDHISPTETYDFWGYNPTSFDYCHGNAIEEDTDGNLLLSFRHLNAIYKIDRTTGNIIWRLGGKSSSFTFPNDAGFSGQHDIRRLANGNYSLFDNANMGSIPKRSRGVEYVLDTINWTATKVYEYINSTNNFSRAMGSYQTLDNGDKVLGYGLIYRPNRSAAIIDPSNNTEKATYYFQDSVVTYRMNPALLPNLPRPTITCNWNGTNWELQAPAAASYLWSTGETTASIILSQIDTFQVWVPLGIGFVGSLPFVVTNLTNPCGATGVVELQSAEEGEFILYDFMGRIVAEPKRGAVYVKVWKSGGVRKVVYEH